MISSDSEMKRGRRELGTMPYAASFTLGRDERK
jgi:hypothetical protein